MHEHVSQFAGNHRHVRHPRTLLRRRLGEGPTGRLVLFITSKGTLDKLDGALREYVSHQADLFGANRLPIDAFKKNANTEVTTDIVTSRKMC